MINGPWLWHSMEQTNFTNWDSGYPKRLRSGAQKRHRLVRRHPMSYHVPYSEAVAEWESSAPYYKRPPRSLSKNQNQWTGPRRVCVITLPKRTMVWRNVQCVRSPTLPFICMKNPN